MGLKDRLNDLGLKERVNDLGLKNRVRETTGQAIGGLAKGQAKLEEYRGRQSINSQLQALGQAYWVQQSGRATPAQLTALLGEVRPAIKDSEARTGELAWPSVPSFDAATAPSTASSAPAGVAPRAPGDLIPDPTPPTPASVGVRLPPAVGLTSVG